MTTLSGIHPSLKGLHSTIYICIQICIIIRYSCRFVCNQKVDFAVKQGQEELRQVLIDQRTELLNIFQDDRQQMIEEHAEALIKRVESVKEQDRLANLQKLFEMRTEYDQQICEWQMKWRESEQKHENDVDELKQQMNLAIQ